MVSCLLSQEMKANSRLSFEGGDADSRFRKRMSRNVKWLEGFGPDLQKDKHGLFCPKTMVRDSYDHYKFFMNEFGPRLVGVKYYKEICTRSCPRAMAVCAR